MVKKLRTRQIIAETDAENDNTPQPQPQLRHITKTVLKQKIMKKLRTHTNNHTQKHNKYQQIIQNGLICHIVDQNKLECPICLQLMVRPTLMNCGHMYCYRCLQSNSAHSATCCLCRSGDNQPSYVCSVFAQTLINEVLLPRSNEIIKYLCRTTDATEWMKRREMKNVKVGTILDFQDAFRVWRKAIVVKMFAGTKGQLMLNLKSFFKGNEIQETIEASSRRLAPCNFFTRSKYLQQFAPVLPQYDLYQNELDCLEYRSFKSEDDLFNFNQNEAEGQSPQNIWSHPQNIWLQNNGVNSSLVDKALGLLEWQMNGDEMVL